MKLGGLLLLGMVVFILGAGCGSNSTKTSRVVASSISAGAAERVVMSAYQEAMKINPAEYSSHSVPTERTWLVTLKYLGTGFAPHRETLHAHVIRATGEIYFEDTDISEGLLTQAAAVAIARAHFLGAGEKPEKLEIANNSRMRSAWLVRLQPRGDEGASEASYLGVNTIDGSIVEGNSLKDLMEREFRSAFGSH